VAENESADRVIPFRVSNAKGIPGKSTYGLDRDDYILLLSSTFSVTRRTAKALPPNERVSIRCRAFTLRRLGGRA
jgi:hypothetical protein